MEENLRLFYAIELPGEIKIEIEKTINKLQSLAGKIKWVAEENLHLTLRFLGNVNPDKVNALIKTAETVSGMEKPFLYSLKGIGAFPNLKKPNVIWIGCGSGFDSLKRIAKNIEDNLTGFEKECHPFKPHITIGRNKGRFSKIDLAPILSQYPQTAFGEFTVNGISLIKSILTKEGPIYSTLFKSDIK